MPLVGRDGPPRAVTNVTRREDAKSSPTMREAHEEDEEEEEEEEEEVKYEVMFLLLINRAPAARRPPPAPLRVTASRTTRPRRASFLVSQR